MTTRESIDESREPRLFEQTGLLSALILVLLSAGLHAPLSGAQESQQDSEQSGARVQAVTLDEVVVTARRREESLQDTPIAVTALSAQDLRDRGITNTRELTKSVPSLEIATGQSTQIYIRGVGERTGFVRVDPAVGVYLDDIYIPQADSQLLDTVDVANIQVLRGPQGTLFGKNNTGGALVLSLAKPTDVLEGYIEASLGNYGLVSSRAAINIPVTDRFFTRLAVNSVVDDGYTKDVGTGDRNDSNNRQAVLVQTRWDAADNISLDTLFFYGRVRERFSAVNCRINNEDALFMRGLYLMWSGDTDPSNPRAYRENCESNSRENLPDLRTNLGPNNRNYDNDLTNYMLGANLDWAFSENHSLKTVLGLQLGNRGPINSNDSDGGPKVFSGTDKPRESDRLSTSLEVQLSGSLFNHRLNYTAGLFGMYEENDESFMLITGIAGVDLLTLLQLGAQQFPTQPSPGGTIPFVGLLTDPLLDSQFGLNNTTLAAYFQGSYDITDNLQLTVGMRYTEEKRESDLTIIGSDMDAIEQRLISTGLFGPSLEGFQQYLGPGGWADDPVGIAVALFPDTNGDGIPNFPKDFSNPQRDKGKETFTRFTPMASLSYNLPDNWLQDSFIDTAMVYGTWSNGFKSGFFEPRGADGLQRVEQETVENRELGFKIDAFQRRLRFNAALYSMIFDDMQLIIPGLDSQGGLVVTFNNAGKSKIEGAELELTWLPLPGLMMNLSYSENRYTFIDFEDVDLLTLAVQQREVVVDRSDEPFVVSPERTIAFGMQYLWDTGLGSFIPRVDVSYKSDIYLGLDRGSFEMYRKDKSLAGQEAFALVDFRFGWTNRDEDISAALFVKNLTDERYFNGTASVADSVGTFSQSYGEPRRFGVELRYLF